MQLSEEKKRDDRNKNDRSLIEYGDGRFYKTFFLNLLHDRGRVILKKITKKEYQRILMSANLLIWPPNLFWPMGSMTVRAEEGLGLKQDR